MNLIWVILLELYSLLMCTPDIADKWTIIQFIFVELMNMELLQKPKRYLLNKPQNRSVIFITKFTKKFMNTSILILITLEELLLKSIKKLFKKSTTSATIPVI